MNRLLTARTTDWSALDAYLRDVGQEPVLTDEELVKLGAQAASGDLSAQERLIKAHLRLVVRIAHQYSGYGLPLADVISEGNLGLIRAAELYDPQYATKFSTYAALWIKQRIHRAISSQTHVVRVPLWRSQRLRKLARLHDELLLRMGKIPTEDELASRLGLSPEDLAELREDKVEIVSLDAAPEEGAGAYALAESLADPSAETPAALLGRKELLEEIVACLHDLDDRELEVITRKFGFRTQEDAISLRELGRRWGLSHEWVRRIAELALVKVRRALDGGKTLSEAERARREAKVRRRMNALAAA